MLNRVLLRSSPYLIAIGMGFLLFVWGQSVPEGWGSLLTGVASAFLAIPLLYLSYDLVTRASHRKLSKELLDYVKMQVDTEVLTVLNHLSKVVCGYEGHDFSNKGVNRLLSLGKADILEKISKSTYVGFQVLKSWEVNEEEFQSILKTPLIVKHLDDEQVISIIRLLRGFRTYDLMFKKKDAVFESVGKPPSGYKAVKGTDLSPDNSQYKDRFILMEHLTGRDYRVTDFGDFPKYNQKDLLCSFVIKNSARDYVASTIHDTLSEINRWLSATGGEFILHPR
ncbi:MAG: hypothetical protein JRN15_22240 [Nitrososphaerota archaeon]|nr:hypothetical protein [Nitrososphaerota archaeon]